MINVKEELKRIVDGTYGGFNADRQRVMAGALLMIIENLEEQYKPSYITHIFSDRKDSWECRKCGTWTPNSEVHIC